MSETSPQNLPILLHGPDPAPPMPSLENIIESAALDGFWLERLSNEAWHASPQGRWTASFKQSDPTSPSLWRFFPVCYGHTAREALCLAWFAAREKLGSPLNPTAFDLDEPLTKWALEIIQRDKAKSPHLYRSATDAWWTPNPNYVPPKEGVRRPVLPTPDYSHLAPPKPKPTIPVGGLTLAALGLAPPRG